MLSVRDRSIVRELSDCPLYEGAGGSNDKSHSSSTYALAYAID